VRSVLLIFGGATLMCAARRSLIIDVSSLL
jgi:hypothetical protein